jgi:hypothetical protein
MPKPPRASTFATYIFLGKIIQRALFSPRFRGKQLPAEQQTASKYVVSLAFATQILIV